MPALLRTDLPGLPPPTRGKVRDVYELDAETLLVVTTDRLSAFDVILPTGIPDKGRVLNSLSAFWFELLADLGPNHVLSIDDSVIRGSLPASHPDLQMRSMLCRKANPLPVEFVVRGYLAGSLLKEYRLAPGPLHGIDLPAGLREGDQLPEPIFTPATKAQEGHDENISFDQAAELVGRGVAEAARDWSIRAYRAAAAHAEACGLILADTKLEFGLIGGELIWIDEAFTPDSSRYWLASEWRPGESTPSFDKQYVRDYLDAQDWDKQPPGPDLPEAVALGARQRYLEAYRRLTGKELPV